MIALYAGSFDPLTLGHLNILEKAGKLFEKVVVVILENSQKQAFLDAKVRLGLLEKSLESLDGPFECALFEGLTVEACKKFDARVLIRGLRNGVDFDYEQNIARINQYLDPSIESVFLICDAEYQWISSSNVRELYKYRQDISALVPKPVAEYLSKEN